MRGKLAKRLRREEREKIDVVNYYYRDYNEVKTTKFATIDGEVYPFEVTRLVLKDDCLKGIYKKSKKNYLNNKRNVW